MESPEEHILNENFRNTNQITKFCNESFKMNVAQTGVDGRKVSEIIRSKLEEVLATISVNEERVAILLPRGIRKKEYLDMDQLPSVMREIIGDRVGNGRICVSYVDEVKGIEFDIVFVVVNGMSNNEKYIAYTRALTDLTLVFDDEIEEKLKEKEKNKLKSIEKITADISENNMLSIGSGNNIKFGRIKSNKEKAKEYVKAIIVYRCKCSHCDKEIELTQEDVDKYMAADLELPKTCNECKRKLDENINIGNCKYCKKSIVMKRSDFEYLKREKKLKMYCPGCLKKYEEDMQNDKLYQRRECSDCQNLCFI